MTNSLPSLREARHIVGLALPLSLVQLAQVAISTTDIVMLGWLGGEALAGGALGFFAFNLLRTMGFGLIVGTSNLVAADQRESVASAHLLAALIVASGAAMLAAGCFVLGGGMLGQLGQDPAVAAIAAHYLILVAPGIFPLFWFYAYRGVVVGRRKTNSLLVITLATIVINAAFDYGFIYGAFGLPRLGAAGVAASSSIAYLAQFGAIVWVTHASFRFERLVARADIWNSVRRLLAIGIPTAGSYGSEAGFTAVITLMVGTFGAAALAGHAVVNQITYVVFMLSIGLSHATSIGVSEGVGRGSAAAALRSGRTGLVVVAAIMAVFAALYLLFPHNLLAAFGLGADTAAVTAVALTLLPLAAAMQIFDGLQNVAIGALRGVQRAGISFWVTMVGYWVVGVPVAWLLGLQFHLGPAGIWIGLALGLVVTALGMVVTFERSAMALPSAAATA
ncbi:MATE family efflux transporter [Devosia neptuniae]|uniref:Multidrug-efflux transporter n=1 Tax=Devosia neptuniae TaxID=191302 RepID=A0ABY6CKW4_9HYPH|nr:MATE family efflux transporter [Devosia neptuniae]UXN72027.1 MATE family efflux transporter [Devosia neptuniae]